MVLLVSHSDISRLGNYSRQVFHAFRVRSITHLFCVIYPRCLAQVQIGLVLIILASYQVINRGLHYDMPFVSFFLLLPPKTHQILWAMSDWYLVW